MYDADTVGSPGLVGRSVNVELDGAVAMTVITGTSGLFSFELPADSSIARGEHQIAVKFQGEELYLPAIANSSVLVRANIDVQVIWSDASVIRSDQNNPIRIEGRIVEVGGDSEIVSDIEVKLGWNGQSLSLIHI